MHNKCEIQLDKAAIFNRIKQLYSLPTVVVAAVVVVVVGSTRSPKTIV